MACDKHRTDPHATKHEATHAVSKHPAPGREINKPRVSAAHQVNELVPTVAGCEGRGSRQDGGFEWGGGPPA